MKDAAVQSPVPFTFSVYCDLESEILLHKSHFSKLHPLNIFPFECPILGFLENNINREENKKSS